MIARLSLELVRCLAFTLLVLFSASVLAEEPAEAPSGAPAPEAKAKEEKPGEPTAESLVEEAQALSAAAKDKHARFKSAEGEDLMVLVNQMIAEEADLRAKFDEIIKFIEKQDGNVNSATLEAAQRLVREHTEVLKKELELVTASNERLRKEREQMQEEEAAPEKLLDHELRISRATSIGDDLAKALDKNIQRMGALGIDTGADTEFLINMATERASTISGRLELTLEQLDAAQSRLSTAAEGDKGPIEIEIKAIEEKKERNANSLAVAVEIMDAHDLDSAEYKQILVRATGHISEQIFDRAVIAGLLKDWGKSAADWVRENGPDVLIKLLVIAVILTIFKILANIAGKMARKAVNASKLNISSLLKDFFVSVASKAVFVIGILVALSQLGVQIAPLLAGLGVAGFIVGFALQDTLSNFASGLMILIYRPFDVGDLVEAGGVSGKVKEMSLVSTTILTLDNQKLVVPNNKIWGDVIRNVTAQHSRRVDMVFGIGYADDIEHAERILHDIVDNHDRVLESPEPIIKLHTLNESSVDFVVRPWARTDDYWDVYWDITRAVKERFDKEGISIPFPQRDIHVFQETPAAPQPT